MSIYQDRCFHIIFFSLACRIRVHIACAEADACFFHRTPNLGANAHARLRQETETNLGTKRECAIGIWTHYKEVWHKEEKVDEGTKGGGCVGRGEKCAEGKAEDDGDCAIQ